MSSTAGSAVTPESNQTDEDNMLQDAPAAGDQVSRGSHGRTATSWLSCL
jgi:hypothetical protein